MSQTAQSMSAQAPNGTRITPDAAMLRSFAEQGYLIFRNVVPKEKLGHLRDRLFEEYDRSRTSGVLFDGGGGISGHLNCFPGEESRFVYDVVRERGLLDVVK